MTNQKFDDIFKSKLSNPDNAPKSSDWEEFSKILQKSEGFEEVNFDKDVSDKVKEHHVPFSDNHWQILKERLEREQKIRTRLYFAKLSEITAIILLIFGSLSYSGLTFDRTLEVDPQMFAHLYKENVPSANQNKLQEIKLGKLNQATLTELRKGTEAYKKASSEVAPAAPGFATVTETYIADLPSKKQEIVVAATPKFSIHTNEISGLIQPEVIVQEMAIESGDLVAMTPSINTLPIYKPELYASTLTKSEFRPYIGSGINIIRSPFDDVYQNEAATLISRQDKAGFYYAIGTDHLKMTTGIEYNRMKYNPVSVIETYGSLRDGLKQTSLKSIAFQSVRVPVGIKYDFLGRKEKRKVSPYVNANVGINSVLTSEYHIDEEVLPSDFRQIDSGTKRSSNNSKLSNKEFNPGILQGGELVSNLYLDANIEAGIESRITKNIRLTTGISYSRFLASKGLGPNGDRHDNVTLNIGLNYALN